MHILEFDLSSDNKNQRKRLNKEEKDDILKLKIRVLYKHNYKVLLKGG